MRRLTVRIELAAPVVLGGLVLATSAPADAASVTSSARVSDGGDTVRVVSFHADRGERNRVTIAYADGAVTITDAGATVTALGDCTDQGAVGAVCDATGTIVTVEAQLGDGDDELTVSTPVRGEVDVDAGAGDDNVSGSPGADLLIGGPGRDTLRGRGGDDSLDGGSGSDLLDGGPGRDDVDYTRAGGNVTVDLVRDRATARGETDRIPGVEDARTGGGDDVLIGDGGANRLDAGLGTDVVRAGAGNDVIGVTDARARVTCGRGQDELSNPPATPAPADCESLVLDSAVRFGLHPTSRHGRALVAVACVERERCRYGLVLRSHGQRIGAARISVAPRQRAVIAVPLTRSARERLAANRALPVDVVLTDNIIGPVNDYPALLRARR